jgi:hypothetical protein
MSIIRVGNIGPLTGNTSVIADPGGAGGMSLVSMNPVTASGTSVDFTGIPSWARRITVMFNGFSTNGTSNYLIQVGAGSILTSGYSSSSCLPNAGGSTAGGTYTTGYGIFYSNAANLIYGHLIITLFGSNTYVSSHNLGTMAVGAAASGGGAVTLSGALDRVRITTVNGSDTLDAGSINVTYE